ncbi:hypothetical protein HAX54_006765, partial [Datura stramonium]|nr:hypothetical protein [Datura stramonium]
THGKVCIKESLLYKINLKVVKTACPAMEQEVVDEDSHADTPPLFNENEQDFYDSPIISFDETRDFGGGLSQSESDCDSLTFESPLLIVEGLKNMIKNSRIEDARTKRK